MGYGESMRDILAHESRVNEHPTPEDLAAQKRNRLILATFSALSTLFLAGATLGWGPMQLMVSECARKTPSRHFRAASRAIRLYSQQLHDPVL